MKKSQANKTQQENGKNLTKTKNIELTRTADKAFVVPKELFTNLQAKTQH